VMVGEVMRTMFGRAHLYREMKRWEQEASREPEAYWSRILPKRRTRNVFGRHSRFNSGRDLS